MRTPVLAASVAAAVLAAPAMAQAHVTLNPREVTPGSFSVLSVRVPNERGDKGTVKVEVRFPDGFYSVSYKKVPGWRVRIVREQLDEPVEQEGLRITEQISRVIWNGNRKRGGIIRPNQFEEFPISVRIPEGEPGSFLMFKAYQTYRGGERVRWSAADPEAETPAPRIRLLAPATTSRRTADA
jgi:periplasmic copper chaperone A